MKTMMKIPLVFEPQKEGGWTITSPFPANLRADYAEAPVWFESLVMSEG